MTKQSVGWALVLATILALATPVQAHGAPESRAIETRIVADDDGFFSYDYGAQAGLATSGGHDLLALDAYEAYANGEPALHLRLIWQTDATEPVRDTLQFTAGGTDYSFDLVSSTSELVSHSFDAADGPTDVGDGHPKAFDLVIRYATIGAQAGDTLSNIQIIGYGSDDGEADIVPGTWLTSMGEEAPYGGDPTHSQPENVSYTLAGPASFLSATGGQPLAGQEGDAFNVSLELSSAIDMDQFVSITAEAPEGITVQKPAGLALAGGGSRTVDLTIDAFAAASGNVRISFQSDLGGFVAVDLPLEIAAAAPDVPYDTTIQSEDLLNGESYSITFDQAGVFHYHNHHELEVGGMITVTRADGVAKEHTIRFDGTFEPAELDIHVGDTVTWINDADALIVMGALSQSGEGGHDHGDHDHEHGDEGDENLDEGAPGIGLIALLGVLAFAGMAMRRK